jgi:hypothetical protein
MSIPNTGRHNTPTSWIRLALLLIHGSESRSMCQRDMVLGAGERTPRTRSGLSTSADKWREHTPEVAANLLAPSMTSIAQENLNMFSLLEHWRAPHQIPEDINRKKS